MGTGGPVGGFVASFLEFMSPPNRQTFFQRCGAQLMNKIGEECKTPNRVFGVSNSTSLSLGLLFAS